MANKFFLTVTIPPVPSSDAGLVLARTLRVMQAGEPTIDMELPLDASSHGFDAEEGAKLHLELVDRVGDGPSRTVERAMRKLTVGASIAEAKPGELTLNQRAAMFAVAKPAAVPVAGPFAEAIQAEAPVFPAPETVVESEAESEAAPEAEVSEVADLNADEAKERISRMRSIDKLLHIQEWDTRVTVKAAAADRITALENAAGTNEE